MAIILEFRRIQSFIYKVTSLNVKNKKRYISLKKQDGNERFQKYL